MKLVYIILADFFAYTAVYWVFLSLLVLLYLIFQLTSREGKASASPPDSNAGVLEYFFRKGYQLEDDIFQGRLGAEFVLSKKGEATYVQIKWTQRPVGAARVADLVAAQGKLYCKYAILISKEGFTRAAQRAAADAGVWLWDLYNVDGELERFSALLAHGLRAVAAAGD